MARTIKDLIVELQEIGNGSFKTMFLIAFEKETKYVDCDSEDPLSDLTALIKAGGEPVAICRVNKKEDQLTMSVGPIKEYANLKWMRQYLETWSTAFMKTAKETLGVDIMGFDFPCPPQSND